MDETMVELKFVGPDSGYIPGLGANENKVVEKGTEKVYLESGWWVLANVAESVKSPVENKFENEVVPAFTVSHEVGETFTSEIVDYPQTTSDN